MRPAAPPNKKEMRPASNESSKREFIVRANGSSNFDAFMPEWTPTKPAYLGHGGLSSV